MSPNPPPASAQAAAGPARARRSRLPPPGRPALLPDCGGSGGGEIWSRQPLRLHGPGPHPHLADAASSTPDAPPRRACLIGARLSDLPAVLGSGRRPAGPREGGVDHHSPGLEQDRYELPGPWHRPRPGRSNSRSRRGSGCATRAATGSPGWMVAWHGISSEGPGGTRLPVAPRGSSVAGLLPPRLLPGLGQPRRRMFQEGGSIRSASNRMFRFELSSANGAPSQTASVTSEATVKAHRRGRPAVEVHVLRSTFMTGGGQMIARTALLLISPQRDRPRWCRAVYSRPGQPGTPMCDTFARLGSAPGSLRRAPRPLSNRSGAGCVSWVVDRTRRAWDRRCRKRRKDGDGQPESGPPAARIGARCAERPGAGTS